MDRRDFVRLGAIAGAAAVGGKPLFAETFVGDVPETRALNRSFEVPPFELEETTIADLQSAMASGRMTARSITQAYLNRITELDRKGPTLRHVIEVNPDALAIADSLDRERKAGRVRGPLHGIPILLKDNIDTADKMTTTAGSLALAGSIPPTDAFIAMKLRAAGAIFLGKANLSEWANFRSTHSTSGWSGRGGQAKNPYVLDRNPCGSSSGSGGAVAANLCAAAIGTETDGSIVCPSSANGIVGIKPTLGLLSRTGIIPIAHSQDTAGPMTRTMRDAAIMPTAPVKSVQQIIAFNDSHKDQEMPWFGQEIMIQAQAKGPLSEKKYRDELAKDLKMSRTDGIDATMTKYKLDAIIAPTGGPAWPTDLINGDHFSGGSSTPAAVAGYPNINVPAGFSHNLPIGISFFGRAYSEPVLIRIAYAYEQATKHRRAPTFIPTLGDS